MPPARQLGGADPAELPSSIFGQCVKIWHKDIPNPDTDVRVQGERVYPVSMAFQLIPQLPQA